MPLEINIADEHIVRAEELLLPDGQSFNDERIAFIKCLKTIDLQAVPGSGKTTALLAKLIALEKYLPLANGSGVLVLSHTNAAIEEITRKISKHCPKLFSYPNFVGTIQSFVDTFLCIPAYTKRYGYKPSIIDDDVYINATYVPQACRGYLNNRGDKERILFLSRLTKDGRLVWPNNPSEFPLKDPNKNTYQALYKMKFEIRKKGILCFEDAYILADEYIKEYPRLKKILQSRFKYVFVDEMQDMDQLQYELLEQIFFDSGSSECIFQRIGDRNQAIYGGNIRSDDVWTDRENVLSITGSHRLTIPIAELVDLFAVHRDYGFKITGLQEGLIKPHLLVYRDDSIENVIGKFIELILKHDGDTKIITGDEHPIYAIGWIKDKDDPKKVSIHDYYPNFNKINAKAISEYNCLDDYLTNIDLNSFEMKAIRKNIVNVFLKVLRIESIRSSTGAYFNENTLIRFLKELGGDVHDKFQIILFNAVKLLIRNKKPIVLHGLRATIPKFIKNNWGIQIEKCEDFLNKVSQYNISNSDANAERTCDNIIICDGVEVRVSTIHGVKGQTHAATLYLETYYQKDGIGKTAKSYESQRLAAQFKNSTLRSNVRDRVKQSAKMCYVGMSRPKHFLCFAVHKDRYDEYLSDIKEDKWEIIEV